MKGALACFVFAACASNGAPPTAVHPPATSEAPPTPPTYEELHAAAMARPIEELGRELGELRATKGHFGGGTEWNDDVDRWGGRKHVVLAALLQRLCSSRPDDRTGTCSPGTSRNRVVELMGAPDEVATRGSMPWTYALEEREASSVRELLVYHWRGGHDFVFFAADAQGDVRFARWWMAGE